MRFPIGLVAALALGTAAGMHGVPVAAAAPKPSVQARLRALQDDREIRNLLDDYGHRFDVLDLKGYSELFSVHGTWKGNYGGSYVTATGPKEVLAMMTRVLGTPHYEPNKVAGLHLMTNFFIRIDGDEATSSSRWTFFTREGGNELVPSLAGHYEDKLIRENNRWKFLERRVFRDVPPEQ